MEDYNTATMPHEKYYNYEAWEFKEHQRKLDKKERKRSKVQDVFNDEEVRRQELLLERQRKEEAEFQETLQRIAADKEKRDAMRSQNILRTQLQTAYRQGALVAKTCFFN